MMIMKRFLFGLIVLSAFAVSFAAAPADAVVDGAYFWELDTTIAETKFDSLSGDDSIVIAAAFRPEAGWEYILVTNALTENAEAEMILNIASLDEDGDVLYVSSAVDTLADGGGAVLLPFGSTCMGTSFKLVLVDGAADDSGEGTETVLNAVKIYRRNIVTGKPIGVR
jgi:hypothetical protein